MASRPDARRPARASGPRPRVAVAPHPSRDSTATRPRGMLPSMVAPERPRPERPREEPREAEERVRFCLSCGAVVAFEEPACPACGQVDAGVPRERPSAPCPACGQSRTATLLFCPHCGREARPERPRAGGAPAAARDGGAEAVDSLSIALALLGPLLVAFAVFQLLPTRGG